MNPYQQSHAQIFLANNFNNIQKKTEEEGSSSEDASNSDSNMLFANQDGPEYRVASSSKVNFSKLLDSEKIVRLKNMAKEIKALKKKLRMMRSRAIHKESHQPSLGMPRIKEIMQTYDDIRTQKQAPSKDRGYASVTLPNNNQLSTKTTFQNEGHTVVSGLLSLISQQKQAFAQSSTATLSSSVQIESKSAFSTKLFDSLVEKCAEGEWTFYSSQLQSSLSLREIERDNGRQLNSVLQASEFHNNKNDCLQSGYNQVLVYQDIDDSKVLSKLDDLNKLLSTESQENSSFTHSIQAPSQEISRKQIFKVIKLSNNSCKY